MAQQAQSRFNWWSFVTLAAIFLTLAFLWTTPWVYPLKLFVVLLHEASHALAAIVTGGEVVEIRVFMEEGGQTVTAGGNRFLITSAGYLGSMAFGAAILLAATRTRLAQWVAALLGICAVTTALKLMPDQGRWFAVACGVVLAGSALGPRPISEFVLRVIGVASCLYAILDIKSDILDRRDAPSDATALANSTGVPALVWGILWILIALAVTFFTVKWAVMGSAEPVVRSRAR